MGKGIENLKLPLLVKGKLYKSSLDQGFCALTQLVRKESEDFLSKDSVDLISSSLV